MASSSAGHTTRQKTEHFILGHASELPTNVLPVERQVFNYFKYVQNNQPYGTKVIDIACKVASKLITFWKEDGNIPSVLSTQQVTVKVEQVVLKAKTIMKLNVTQREKLKHDGNASEIMECLFDICSCKCVVRESCKCNSKVPIKEWDFLCDQRTERQRFISSAVDKKTTKLLTRRQIRKFNEEERFEKHKKIKLDESADTSSLSSSESHSTDSSDPIFTPADSKTLVTTQNRQSLKNFVAELDRYAISDRAGAALATALFEDLEMVDEENQTLVTDKNKIRRERQQRRKEQKCIQEKEIQDSIHCIGFDGKRDKLTKEMIVSEVGSGPRYEQITEEHIVYTREPGGSYITHSCMDEGQGKGRDIGHELVDVLREYNSTDCIQAVVCDGTATNTGLHNGAITYAERELHKNLIWLICQLHGNECPMRHLFTDIDGGFGTSGPNSFKGPIGQSLQQSDLHKSPVIKFKLIKSCVIPIDDKVLNDLSHDQKLLYRYSQAVTTGTVPPELASNKPGPLNHARWLTLALRALIKYTRELRPTKGLKKFICYLQDVYIPEWFFIKSHPNMVQGVKNVFSLIQLLQSQPRVVLNSVLDSVQTNAYFAHSEHLLLTMLSDDNKSIREKAVDTIIKIRQLPEADCEVVKIDGVRKYSIPLLNFKADCYTNIIHLEIPSSTEPPLTLHLSDSELMSYIETAFVPPTYPNHSQSVERAVKQVSKATSLVYGKEERHKLIISREAATRERPAYDSKKQYKSFKKELSKTITALFNY